MSDCIGPTNIIPNNNEVVLQDVNRTITVIDNNCCTTVTVTQPIVETIQVNIPGPQGPTGPSGESAPFNNLGNGYYSTTSSLNITGSLNATNITSSLYGTSSWATNAITASFISTLRATGSNTYIQFNNNGLLGASLAFAVDDFNGALYVRNQSGQDGGNIIIASRFGDAIYLGNMLGGNTSPESGLYSLNGDQIIASSNLTTYKYSNGFYNYDNPNSKHTFTGSVNISNILTLDPQHPLPSNIPTGSFAVSSSNPPKPYFWDGSNWNALY